MAALRRPSHALRYLARGRELSNFTYQIANEDELISFLSHVFDHPRLAVENYVRELIGDRALDDAVTRTLRVRRDRNPNPMFGRRVGWYALCRIVRPSLVVETGTRDGLGTTALAAALRRNSAEGSGGIVLSLDIDPNAGWLIPPPLRPFIEIAVGDARETLPVAVGNRQIDVLIHDSHHTYEHERFELDFARSRGVRVLVSDNSHATSALSDLAQQAGWRYDFFREQPFAHFYPGGGIGLALPAGDS